MALNLPVLGSISFSLCFLRRVMRSSSYATFSFNLVTNSSDGFCRSPSLLLVSVPSSCFTSDSIFSISVMTASVSDLSFSSSSISLSVASFTLASSFSISSGVADSSCSMATFFSSSSTSFFSSDIVCFSSASSLSMSESSFCSSLMIVSTTAFSSSAAFFSSDIGCFSTVSSDDERIDSTAAFFSSSFTVENSATALSSSAWATDGDKRKFDKNATAADDVVTPYFRNDRREFSTVLFISVTSSSMVNAANCRCGREVGATAA
mmetsp:Transcript_17747/g.29043  ORF Transcript_17747/g.29043 Transcript_17747/m.29043 type:complete len:264 (+) Transcript_17747:555-1346(+)